MRPRSRPGSTSSAGTTRLQAAAVVFEDYDATTLGLARTPYAYLVPVGSDLTRDPHDHWRFRRWQVSDALLPQSPGGNEAGPAGQRRHAASRAYNDFEFDRYFSIYDRSLIGRSVANTRWLLIVPGNHLATDPRDGLRRLIGDDLDPGIGDIRLYLRAYSFAAG